MAITLLVASCSGGGDSSESKGSSGSTPSTGTGAPKTPTAFQATGAEAAVAEYVDSLDEVYVGDCAAAEVPRDRGKWCSALVEDGADTKVYDVGPVGEDPEFVVTVNRRGTETLTPGFEVDVSSGDIGPPRHLTIEQLIANTFITGNIILDQQAGIGNGLADLPGAQGVIPDGGGGAGGGAAGGAGGTGDAGLIITVVPGGGQGTAAYPPPPPSITVDDPNVRVGGDVVIRGHNCGANETLAVLFDGKQVGTIQSDAQGNFVTAINIPLGTKPGAHTVTVKGSVCELSVTINVLGLAFTGAGNDTGTIVLVGVSVLALGVVLVVGSRRRRSSGSGVRRSGVT